MPGRTTYDCPNTGYAPLNKGHTAGEAGIRAFCRYTVYNNRAKVDLPVIVDGTAQECAKALKMASVNSFYSMVNRVRVGKNKKYTVITRFLDEDEDNLES